MNRNIGIPKGQQAINNYIRHSKKTKNIHESKSDGGVKGKSGRRFPTQPRNISGLHSEGEIGIKIYSHGIITMETIIENLKANVDAMVWVQKQTILREKYNENAKRWRQNNPEKHREYRRMKNREYYERNKAILNKKRVE